MGKIQFIKKSRKEHRCSKCGETIPVGKPYLKGILNFHPDIVRCLKCGLKQYEVTTSEYTRNVGAIVEDWENDFDLVSGVWDDLADLLDEIRDEQQERLDNMPEQLQTDSETGQLLQERIDCLESTIDELRNIDVDDLLTDAYDELAEEHQKAIDEAGEGKGYYENWYDVFFGGGSDAAAAWKEAFKEELRQVVDEALSYLCY